MAVAEIGRLCLKIAGRDSNKKCLIVDILENDYVLIDGETRRKKCNIKHLEPTDKVIKISKGASHNDVVKEFKKLGIVIKLKVKKEKKVAKEEKPEKPSKKKPLKKTK